jgi:hypothetical protein
MKKIPFQLLHRMHPPNLSREERIADIIAAFMGIGVGLMFIGMAVAFIAMQMFGAAVSFTCLGLLGIGLGWHLGEGVRRDAQWRDGSRTWEEPK